MVNVHIRPEESRDDDAVHALHQQAFRDHPHSNQTEHHIVRRLRAANALAVALTAERDGEVLGHIAFSPVTIDGKDCSWYGLGPVAVLPRVQGQGIGSALVRRGLERLRVLGACGCVLVGEPAYYGRFGFARHESLVCKGIPQDYVLALPFGNVCPHGFLCFHDAFGVNSSA